MWPKLFSIDAVDVYSYGACMSLGFLFGLFVLLQKDFKGSIQKNHLADLMLTILISSILGARILYVIVNRDFFLENPLEILMLHKGGLVYYGGLIGGLAGCFGYIKIKKLPFFLIADGVVVSLALGQSIGRIGCFLFGCCYGLPSKYLGVCFPKLTLPSYHYGWPHFIFPIQLISSLCLIMLFVFLSYVFAKKKYDGQVFSYYFMGYGIIRFLTEFLRGDVPSIFLNLTQAQWISIASIIFGGLVLGFTKKKLNN